MKETRIVPAIPHSGQGKTMETKMISECQRFRWKVGLQRNVRVQLFCRIL